MLDIKLIREDPAWVKAEIAKLNADAPIDDIVRLDEQRRALLTETEDLKAERNRVSKSMGSLQGQIKKASGDEKARLEGEFERVRVQMSEVGERIKALDEQVREIDEALDDALLRVPNLPDPSVPVGPDESHNVIVRQEGGLPRFDFEPLPHWDLGPMLGILDFERGVKISGTRFYVLKRAGARLQRALIAWMIDLHVSRHGYTEIYPPFVVQAKCLVGTGQLPKFDENLYHDVEDDFWLVPTAEVPVTNLYRDEIIEPGVLPIYHVAYTPCWRREKMSAGRDVRGIKRGHQFDKVEMVKIVEPETSMRELETLIDNAEDVCRMLKIPHRIVQMCTGDLSFTAAVKYDVEVWAAGCGEWLEVSSCSNFKDFQARRAMIRYRKEKGGRVEFAHTLNGSGLALPRLMIAVLENYQQDDGSVAVPEVLRPYMGGIEAIRAPGM
ncbi:MAG: serine--tRNA ligase [Anaerolineae bacterium]|nr:serine--tRNA ligase [Anaerolineae bacterium]